MSSPDGSAWITRGLAELFGRHPGYGFAGSGVSTVIGNYTQTTVDLSFPQGLLGLLTWDRTYNSRNTAVGPLGRGWTTTFSAHLTVAPDQAVEFHDEDGRVLTFAPAGSGQFRRAPDLEADLVRDGDGGYALQFTSGTRWLFDGSGRLTGRVWQGQRVTVDHD